MNVKHPRLVLLTVCAIALMSTAGIAMPYPILAPIFMSPVQDAFNTWLALPAKLLLGIALAANPLGILIGSLFIGALADKLGRKRVLMSTLSLTFFGYLLTAYALWSRDYPLFVISRFITGLTESNVAVARAMISDLHPQIDKARAFALLNAVLYIGWLVGPLIGGLTLPLGQAVPFWLAAASLIPCVIVLGIFLPETAEPLHQQVSLWKVVKERNSLRLLTMSPLLMRLFYMQLAFAIGVNAFYEFYPLWLVEYAQMHSQGIAGVTAGLCLIMTLSSIVMSKLGQRHSPLHIAQRYAVIFAVGLCTLTFFGALAHAWTGVIIITLLGLPLAVYNAMLPVWCSERFAQFGQGSIMGLLSTIFCIANIVISLLGGLLSMLDTRLVLLTGAITCGIAALRLRHLIDSNQKIEHISATLR